MAITESMKVRGAGIAAAMVGLYFLKTSFFDVLGAVERHQPFVTTSGKATIVAPAFLVLGAIVALLPANALAANTAGPSWLVDQRTQRVKPIFWIGVVCCSSRAWDFTSG